MALDEYARAEYILRSIAGESDPHIGCIFLHRGDVFACQFAEGADEGVFTLAHSWYERAVENALHTLPEDDAHTIMCRARFGRLYKIAKNEARSMHFMTECLELAKAHSSIGSQHSKLRASLCVSIGDILRHGSDAQQEDALLSMPRHSASSRRLSAQMQSSLVRCTWELPSCGAPAARRASLRGILAQQSPWRGAISAWITRSLFTAPKQAPALSMLGRSMREEAISACTGVLARIEKAKRIAARKKRDLAHR